MARRGLQGCQGPTDPSPRTHHPHHPHHPRTALRVQSSDVQSSSHVSSPSIHCPHVPWHHGQTSYLRPLRSFGSASNAPPTHVVIICPSNTRPPSVRSPYVSSIHVHPHNVRPEHVRGLYDPTLPPWTPRLPSKLHAAFPSGFRYHSSPSGNVCQPAGPTCVCAHADLHARSGKQYDLSHRQRACGRHHTIANGGQRLLHCDGLIRWCQRFGLCRRRLQSDSDRSSRAAPFLCRSIWSCWPRWRIFNTSVFFHSTIINSD